MTIAITYCLVFLFSIIHGHINKCRDNQNIKATIIYTSICHISAWLVHFICSMTTFIQKDDNLDDSHDTANYIICSMVILHPFLFYILTTFRIYNSFTTSSFKLSLIEFIIISIFGTIAIICRFIEQTSWILIIHGNAPIINVDNISNYLWTFIAFDIITRSILIYLFVRKLFMIVMTQSDAFPYPKSPTSTTTSNTIENEVQSPRKQSVALNEQQLTFLGLIEKITLLGVFSAIPLAIARVIFVIDFAANKGFFTHENWIMFNTLQCMAVFFELLAIVLSFNFNERLYYIFCRYCDKGCQKCLQKQTKRRITMQQNAMSTSVIVSSLEITIANSKSQTEE